MVDLNDIRIFVTVARLGAISGAAKALGMPVSTVSRRLSALEEELGATLVQRTTRRLTLTAHGRSYLGECSEPLDVLQDAERVLTRAQQEPEGTLRITGPVVLREPPFLEFVSGFLKTHPRIRIDLVITNEFVDLVAQGVDLGIRIGELSDSSLIAKRLGTTVRFLVASPAYLKRSRAPAEPEDLTRHECVLLNPRSDEVAWTLVSGRKEVSVRVSGPVASRDFSSVGFFARRGHGIALLPSTYCDEGIATGELVRVLPRWTSPSVPLHAVYPTRKYLPAKLRAFLEALEAWETPPWSRDGELMRER